MIALPDARRKAGVGATDRRLEIGRQTDGSLARSLTLLSLSLLKGVRLFQSTLSISRYLGTSFFLSPCYLVASQD